MSVATAKETKQGWTVEGHSFACYVQEVVVQTPARKDGRYVTQWAHKGYVSNSKNYTPAEDVHWTEADAVAECLRILKGIKEVVDRNVSDLQARLDALRNSK